MMRQSRGNTILHIRRQYINYKITLTCVNIGKHYKCVSISDLPYKYKGKNISRIYTFLLFLKVEVIIRREGLK
jgi:hypothetical protein